MVSSEQIAEVLKNHEQDGISDVIVGYNGRVGSLLKSRFDPNRSYVLLVHCLTDECILRFRVSGLAGVRLDGKVTEALSWANLCFFSGGLGIDSENTVTFEVNHPCRVDDDNDPSPQVFEKLMDGLLNDIGEIEMIIMSAVLCDMGLSGKRVDNIMGILFPDSHYAADKAK